MGQINPTLPSAGSTLNSIADPELITALQTIITLVNGNLDTSNLSPSAAITSGQLAAGLAPPIGAVMQYGGATDPTGGAWVICDGRAISRSTYSTLFGQLGTAYGQGDGSTTFNIPELRGRVAVGAGQGSGLTNRTRGQTGGEETHLLSTGEMPSHSHTDSGHSHGMSNPPINPGSAGWAIGNVIEDTSASPGVGLHIGVPKNNNFAGGAEASTVGASASILSTGGGGSHNIMQPYLVVNHIIRVQ